MGRSSVFLLTLAAIAVIAADRGLPAADCNGNGIPDRDDLRGIPFRLEEGLSLRLGAMALAVITADIDGDGKVDLATANAGGELEPGESLSILWNQGGSFSGPQVLKVGTYPFHVAAGDLDGDGDLELAAARRLSSMVSILPNSGNREFEPPADYAVGDGPACVAFCDLDQDGYLDLATGNSGSVSVLFNQADGRFGPETRIDIGEGINSLAAIDVEGDGRVDLAGGGRSIWEFRNDGWGNLTPSPISDWLSSTTLVAADLDGDGSTDLASVTSSATGAVLWNDGSGLFSVDVGFLAAPAGSLSAADFDGDGVVDLATNISPNLTSWFSIYLNDGNRAFRESKFELDRDILAVAAADFDGDGYGDIAAIPSHAMDFQVLIFTNNGDGTFGEFQPWATGLRPWSIESADLDGDGADDLVLRDFSSAFAVLLNRGGGTFAPPAFYNSSGYAFILCDLDRDGDLDIARSDYKQISVQMNHGDGSFSVPSLYPGSSTYSLIAADLDGDAFIDLAAANDRTWWLAVLFNRGDGTFADPLFLPGNGSALIAGDFDGDARVDLVSEGSRVIPEPPFRAGILYQYRNRGNRGFEDPVSTLIPGGDIQNAVDLDGDGDLDLLAAGPDDLMTGYLNDGHARFDGELRLTVGLAPIAVAAADLDGDGLLDLTALHQGTTDWSTFESAVAVFRNLGVGSYGNPLRYPVADWPTSLQTGDIDGDGDLDLVVANRIPGGLSILLNRGNGSFERKPFFAVGTQKLTMISVALTDLDGDGDHDLAVADEGDNQLAVLWNRGTPPASLDRNQDGVPDECGRKPFHRGDPDGSGEIEVTDAVALLAFLFLDGAPPACRESADANSDGALDLSDPVAVLGYLFLAGPPPADPGPPGAPCGPDPDPAGSAGDLGCEAYAGC